MFIQRQDTLESIELSDSIYELEEFAWSKIKSVVEVSIQGNIIIQQHIQSSGKPITLTCAKDTGWVNRSDVEKLKSWVDTPSLKLNLITYPNQDELLRTVVFDSSKNPLEATAVKEYYSPSPSDPFNVTIRFLEVNDANLTI